MERLQVAIFSAFLTNAARSVSLSCMSQFFINIISRVLSYLLFIIVIFVITTSLLTKTFPPSVQALKAQYEELIELKTNYQAVMKKAGNLDALKKIEENESNQKNNSKTENTETSHINDSNLLSEIKEMRTEQAHIQMTLERLEAQNKVILNQLNKN